jgi:hypothetical protein
MLRMPIMATSQPFMNMRRSFNSFAHTVLYPVQHFYKRIRQTTSGDFDLVIEWRQ